MDDVIYRYEQEKDSNNVRPAFYSLQFDMKERTPEVFAARGIVALQPPLALDAPRDFDYRAAGLAKALAELCGAMDSNAHNALKLDEELREYVDRLSAALNQAMGSLEESAAKIQSTSNDKSQIKQILVSLQTKLGPIAGQGVYLLSPNGDINDCALPPALTNPGRQTKVFLADRFYVRQAKMFRKPFVSDSAESRFNKNSTVFFCHPIVAGSEYRGLLFAAAQIGAWSLPVDLCRKFRERHSDGSFVLVDSNGIALLPPEDRPKAGSSETIPAGENGDDNIGFEQNELHRLSRRDRLISRIWRNIVPLKQDDDVQAFSDLTMYSVVSEVKPANWKLALSVPLIKSRSR